MKVLSTWLVALVLSASAAAASVLASDFPSPLHAFATATPPASFNMDRAASRASMASAATSAHDTKGSGSDEGSIPSATDALVKLPHRDEILVTNDSQWNPANGISGGDGSYARPFVIEGWNVDTILISNTAKCYEIRNDWVGSILVLDWTGGCGHVHHDHLENFRTNRNVKRTGDPTAAVVDKNEIVRIEQLRHFDGTVVDNVIGEADGLQALTNAVVFDIAGFNGAEIARNTIYGGVDMKLHGHHHSSTEDGPTHNHGATCAAMDATLANDTHDGTCFSSMDHTVRYVHFVFHDNTIIDRGFGLRYNDLDHAGDDRTAASESEPALAEPHVHYTKVTIANNTIDGSALRVTVFDAPDELHLAGEHGVLVLENNLLTNGLEGDAITLSDVRDATVFLRGNDAARSDLALQRGDAGILLERFQNDTVRIEQNHASGFAYGVRATAFDAKTTWSVQGERADGSSQDVYWDSSVANPPVRGQDPSQASGQSDNGASSDAATRVSPVDRIPGRTEG